MPFRSLHIAPPVAVHLPLYDGLYSARLRVVGLCASAALCLPAVPAAAQGPITFPEYVHIHFGRFPGAAPGLVPSENTMVSTQFEALWGVKFGIYNAPNVSPIIARADNATAVGFTGANGADGPMLPGGIGTDGGGICGLVDPVGAGNDPCAFQAIECLIDPPALAVRVTLPKTNGNFEPIRFYDSTGGSTPGYKHVDNFLQTGRDESNPATTGFRTRQPNGANDSHCVAIGAITLIRPPQQPLTGPFVEVAQESAVGAGDFDARVLGVLRPRRSPLEAAPRAVELYNYSRQISNPISYHGLGVPTARARSILALADTDRGLGLLIVHGDHDQSAGGTSGTAQMTAQFAGIAGGPWGTGLTLAVADDPDDDSYTVVNGAGGTSTLTTRSDWGRQNSDGCMITGLSGNWSAVLKFDAFDAGLEEWQATSTDGPTVPLALSVGRRVRLRAIPQCITIASPANTNLCPGASLMLTAPAFNTSSGGVISYRWTREAVPNSGVFAPLTDGLAVGLGTVSGSMTSTLQITSAGAGVAARYRCVATSACGETASIPTSVTVTAPACPSDFDCSGARNLDDIFIYLNAWFAGDPRCDVDGNAGVSLDDLFVFINRWFAGC